MANLKYLKNTLSFSL